ncbi:hypothetical protein DPMN_038807 [Dreissena polymorpha]|uniref:Uncharacterized protein n=1 Tax=Dreissena polymorpha TaxID=45954 RepID=A0A9D4MG72_DREPO|nr:hypothetical protein DPMN_038807 [Dreissena polymorpha]
MMGGLHIEMAFLKVLGEWLYDSGWITAITTAGEATAGRAGSIQKGASTSRGQWAHQVMVAALYILKCKAFKEYTERVRDSAEKLDFQQWLDMMDNIYPKFAYWNKTMQLEILFFFLQFMKSQREANFEMYVECLGKMVPWMFAMNHVHYAC